MAKRLYHAVRGPPGRLRRPQAQANPYMALPRGRVLPHNRVLPQCRKTHESPRVPIEGTVRQVRHPCPDGQGGRFSGRGDRSGQGARWFAVGGEGAKNEKDPKPTRQKKMLKRILSAKI